MGVLALIPSLLSAGVPDSTALPGTITGTWKLQSRKRPTYNTISLANKSPIDRITFESCKDNQELRNFPNWMKKMRKTNVFRNICLVERDTLNMVVDTAYPVGRFRGGASIGVTSYGKKLKKEYDITLLTPDSLVIHRSDLYLKEKLAAPPTQTQPKL